jgi:hypothetical protein
LDYLPLANSPIQTALPSRHLHLPRPFLAQAHE